jgi:hypothetical protein
LGLATSGSFFSGCSGHTLVVLAALRATAAVRQPFSNSTSFSFFQKVFGKGLPIGHHRIFAFSFTGGFVRLYATESRRFFVLAELTLCKMKLEP